MKIVAKVEVVDVSDVATREVSLTHVLTFKLRDLAEKFKTIVKSGAQFRTREGTENGTLHDRR